GMDLIFLVVLTGAAGALLVGWERHWLIAVVVLGFWVCWALISSAEIQRTLAERGTIDHCVVENVSNVPNALAVDDDLKCSHGPDTVMGAPWSWRKGMSVTVLWDPSQRISRRPTNLPSDSRIKFRLGVGAAGIAAVLILVDTLIEACRRPKLLTYQQTRDATLPTIHRTALRASPKGRHR